MIVDMYQKLQIKLADKMSMSESEIIIEHYANTWDAFQKNMIEGAITILAEFHPVETTEKSIVYLKDGEEYQNFDFSFRGLISSIKFIAKNK